MGGSRRPYAAFLPLSLRCLLQLPPPLFSSSSVGSFVRSKPLTLPLPPRSRVGSFVGFQKEKEKCGETLGGGENLALTPSLFLVLFSSPFPALISSISLWLFLALSLRNCKRKGVSAVLLPLLYHHAFSSRKEEKGEDDSASGEETLFFSHFRGASAVHLSPANARPITAASLFPPGRILPYEDAFA